MGKYLTRIRIFKPTLVFTFHLCIVCCPCDIFCAVFQFTTPNAFHVQILFWQKLLWQNIAIYKCEIKTKRLAAKIQKEK